LESEAESAIGPYLLAGEALLWCGRPRDTAAVRSRAVLILILAAIALFLRAIPGESSLAAAAQRNSVFFAALVVFLIAEAIVFHSYLAATFYGVTNQRAIIVWGVRERNAAGVPLGRISLGRMILRRRGANLELREAAPESLLDAAYVPFTNPSIPLRWGGRPECYRLIGLQEAGRIYGLILDSSKKPD